MQTSHPFHTHPSSEAAQDGAKRPQLLQLPLSPSRRHGQGEVPSHIKRKQLKHLNTKTLRFQPYPSPEPSSSAYATSSPGPTYSKTTHVDPFKAARKKSASLHVQGAQVILLGRKTPSPATLAQHSATDFFLLPIQSKNISRVHAILTSSSIHVLGQNGLTVDGQDIAPGAAHHFTTTSAASASSSSRVELDFYGDFTLTVHLAAEETHHHQQVVRLQDPLPSPLAVPSSSPSLRPQQLDNDQQEEEEDNFSLGAPAEVKQPEAPTATTPEADLCSEPPTFEFDYSLQPDEDALSDLSDAEESAAAAAAHQTPLSDELVGLLAQMLVFHGKTTVPTSDVLAALCDDGDDRHNADMVMDTLRRGPFGVVENPKLKDASGRQLQPNWYYEPEQDADAGRREALAPFTKRVRKSQMSAKRYVWAKPTLKPRRYY